MKSSWKGVRGAIRLMASRPEGVSVAEMPDFKPRQIINNGHAMSANGELFVRGARQQRRYFTNEADAIRYETESLPAIKEQKRLKDIRTRCAKQSAVRAAVRLPKAQEVGVKIPKYGQPGWGSEKARITSETKVTLCPSPPAFGPAARLLHVKPAQMANRLPELKAGAEL